MSDKCNHTDLAFPDNDAPVCIDCCEYLTDSECWALIQSLQSQLSQENKRVELLAESIGKIAVELDVIDYSMPATGPQVLMIADDSLELIKYLKSDLSKLEQTNLELQFQNNLFMERLELTKGATDGIEARDTTIELLEGEIERLKRGWVKSSDRLPEDNETVIVRGGCGYYLESTKCWYTCLVKTYHGDDAIIQWDVTHWMPLPTPPEGDS